MQSAIIYEGSYANRIALTISEQVSGVSNSNGFSVTVEGQTATISNVAPHPTDSSKIWITISNRVYSGEVVNLAYADAGSIVDNAGNALVSDSIIVTNSTTQ
ncbi:MAG: hypothetical protein K1563_16760 [Candidatus Thiodiazotropha sp. (ex. Lucinisca nassula)]|nr:hypothetical protein [Candidatus Thiodiazotropha sp. (ex. Lucinisca nassula)]MBW9275333.1 hypothetical protein [Candidatus Thiodiazotropha sp. (ex. Lucinisca nassula)]